MTRTFRLPWPPSVNHAWGHRGGRKYHSAAGRTFRAEAIADILRQLGTPLPTLGPVCVCLELTPPTKARRDADNHIKPVLDAIVSSGLLRDDDQHHIPEVRARWTGQVQRPGCCDVIVSEEHGVKP